MRLGKRQKEILLLCSEKIRTREDIYNRVFNTPRRDPVMTSRVSKSILKLERNGLISVAGRYLRLTEEGRKEVERLKADSDIVRRQEQRERTERERRESNRERLRSLS
jgi:DNA-binding PadR family transcriptional regulator